MPEFARLKLDPKDHKEIKSLAAKAGLTIMAFAKELIKAYKGKSK